MSIAAVYVRLGGKTMASKLEALHQAIQQAAGRYTKLVLVVSPRGSGKTKLLQAYAQEYQCPYIPVGSFMAERLLTTLPRFRDTEADRAVAELCQGTGPFLLDNLEVLFDPDLNVDPYRLLTGLARTRIVVAAWPGTWRNNQLTYAFPGHREYRSLSPSEAICLSL